MSATDLAWLAGIIDGEGCVKIRHTYHMNGEIRQRHTPSCEIVVGMTHRSTIERCREIAGCGSNIRQEYKNRKVVCFFWGVYGQNARDLARKLHPYSITKKAKLEEVMSY